MKAKKLILCLMGLVLGITLCTFYRATTQLNASAEGKGAQQSDLTPTLETITPLLGSLNGVNSSTKNVTIFIHGTRLMRSFPLNISKSLLLLDECLSTPKLGLHLSTEIDPANNSARIAQTLHKANPFLFPLETFYIFGWSGKLDIKERRRAAKKLIADINSLIIDPFKEKYNTAPNITIITHSHGGNVALNMARTKTIPFSIENLVLLACPVQDETMHHSKSGLFKNMYSIFSKGDTLQVLDSQLFAALGYTVKKAWKKRSTQPLKSILKKLKLPFFSKRTFGTNINIYHIEVAWKDDVHWSEADFDIYGSLRSYGKRLTALDAAKRRGLRHIEFLIPTFMKKLPTILEEANTIKKDFAFFI